MIDRQRHTFLPPHGTRRRCVFLAEAVLTFMSVTIVATALTLMRPDWDSFVFGRLQHIRFEGDYKRIDRSELEAVVAPYLGRSLFDINLARLEAGFASMPWVREVVIRKRSPGILVVAIKERRALARWGEKGLVDDTGEIFFPDRIAYPELPVFVTDIKRNHIALELYRRLPGWLRLPASEIGYLIEDSNHSWTAVLKHGITVVIGRHDIEKRVKQFARAYASGLSDLAPHIACVDLRYSDGFSVRWKEEGGVSC